jgi:glycerate-2-kinase
VKYGHAAGKLRTIEQAEAAHPIPDEAGMKGTLHRPGARADERTLILCLLSGGGSALLVPLRHHAGRQTKTTDLLLKAGAAIGELNAVRKHLSIVKGGRLARAAFPASVVTLVLSDVIGDRLDVIASGPTAPDNTTFADASRVIEKYGLRAALPERVREFMERGTAGQEQETAKSGENCFKRTRSVIVGGITEALAAAREKAEALGYVSDLITAELQGEARDAARMLGQAALRTRDSVKPGEGAVFCPVAKRR